MVFVAYINKIFQRCERHPLKPNNMHIWTDGRLARDPYYMVYNIHFVYIIIIIFSRCIQSIVYRVCVLSIITFFYDCNILRAHCNWATCAYILMRYFSPRRIYTFLQMANSFTLYTILLCLKFLKNI